MNMIKIPQFDKSKKTRAVISVTVLVSLFSVLLSLRYGSAKISSEEFFCALFCRRGFEKYSAIIYSVRMPRVLGGIFAGIGLSVSGVLLQTVTGNELASPNIVGINSGAGFAIALSLLIFPNFTAISPMFAFFGAITAAMLIVLLGSRTGRGKTAVILSGIAVTAVLNSGISFISMLDSDLLSAYNYFSVGGLNGVNVKELEIPIAVILLSLFFGIALSGKIELLMLGDGTASALGINVSRIRNTAVMLSALSAASVVSFAGLLGFVGLVVPHIARVLVGSRLKPLIICSVFVGISVVCFADLAGRIIFAPSEIPVGIMMSLIGAPFFLILLIKKGRMGYDD